jgi:hypothetical protein
MNAKQKAENLINSMFDAICNKKERELEFFKKRAKQCALICVGEVLIACPIFAIEYWQSVKEEINKL